MVARTKNNYLRKKGRKAENLGKKKNPYSETVDGRKAMASQTIPQPRRRLFFVNPENWCLRFG